MSAEIWGGRVRHSRLPAGCDPHLPLWPEHRAPTKPGSSTPSRGESGAPDGRNARAPAAATLRTPAAVTPRAPAARRFLALHLPLLPIDRLRRTGSPAASIPLATWRQDGNRRLIAVTDTPGLHPGQSMADAQAIHPSLALMPEDAAADAAALHALALWARRWSPLSAVQPPDGLVLDITGSAHLFGGEAALLADALRRLARQGVHAQGAVAANPAAAGALARVNAGSVLPTAEPDLLARLPLAPALRLPAVTLGELNRLGLRLLGDLLAQPRAPLGRRFGPTLLARLDALTGALPASISPVVPPPELSAARELMEPVITRGGIDWVLDHLLEELCGRLADAGLGARRLLLLAWRGDGSVQEVAVGLGRASRSVAHLRRLFTEPLGSLEPRLGFERMALEAAITEPVEQVQSSLEGSHGGELAQLLDRLAQRLWVRRVAARPSHWPEHSVATAPAHDTPPDMPPGWASPEKPVLLLRRPRPVEVVAALPDGPPALFGRPGLRVRQALGPWRLEPEWWRQARPRDGAIDAAARDYWRVELEGGTRLWLYREAATRWLLHGRLP